MKNVNKFTSLMAIVLTVALVVAMNVPNISCATGDNTAGVWIVKEDTEIFWLQNQTSEANYEELTEQIQLFSSELAEKVTENTLPIVYGSMEEVGTNDIILVLDNTLDIAEQGYKIEATETSVKISASDADGLFYGCRNLIQQLLLHGSVASAEDAPYVLERALMLDNGRKYYTVDWIKEMIRELSWSNMNALVLHFSEEMGLGLESKTYPWLAGRDGALGTQAEVTTDNRYLTQEQVAEIVAYAKKYHVEIIPSFDSPGHMNYIVKKFNQKCATEDYTFTYNGVTYTAEAGSEIGNYYHYNGKIAIVQGSRNKEYSRGIDISNEVAVAFTRSLIDEYATFFKSLGCTKFDIGGDELLGWGSAIVSNVNKWQQLDHWKEYAQNRAQAEGNPNYASAVAYDGFMYYMNDLYDLVSGLGYTSVRMWNDDAFRSADTGWNKVVNLNTNIEILYWTATANSSKNNIWTYLVPGHKAYNYLSDYNYYAMIDNLLGNFKKVTQKQIYTEWTPFTFDPNSTTLGAGKNTSSTNPNVKGSAFCIWCDNPDRETQEQVMTNALPLIKANGAKAWDALANETVDYDTFVENLATLGSAPTGTTAVDNIYVIPNVTELETVVAEFVNCDSSLYTSDSYLAYQEAVEAGQAVLNKDRATQVEVDEAVKAITDAKNALSIKTVADTSALVSAINEYETMNSSQYTEETFNAYTSVVNQAKELLNSDGYTQEDVDAAVETIKTAKEGLRSVENVSNVTCILYGSFRASTVYVGKQALLSITTDKDVKVVGIEIYNDLGHKKEFVRYTQNTRNADKNIHTIMFKVTEEERGERTYTAYAILADGTRSVDCLTDTITVK